MSPYIIGITKQLMTLYEVTIGELKPLDLTHSVTDLTSVVGLGQVRSPR